MTLLRALDVKVLRDVARMRGQLAAIALVLACGLAVFLGMGSTIRSLESARASYYAHERLADVFASLERAPEREARKLRAIPGVARVQTRVVADVMLDVPAMVESAIGRLVSLPDHGRPLVNDLRLRAGRLPRSGRGEEVVLAEAFAEAHGMQPGAEFGAVIDGRHETLRVVGIALCPEYTYALGPGTLFPDDRRFGVIWMRREALANAFDLEGAFNDVALAIAPDASVDDVVARVDAVLDRYGGLGAYPRAEQQSAFFLDNELRQISTFAWIVPVVFLAVAAFLLNVVLARVIAGQREQIAAMKAFGYRDREVGAHYAKLVGVVVGIGCVLGVVCGAWLGSAMVGMYAHYFRFPELPYELGGDEVALGVGICAAAAASGTWAAIRRTVRLPPAEAMRPEAPPVYRATVLERVGLAGRVPVALRIVLRELERQPRRALFSIGGVAIATALTIMNAFSFDSIQHILNVQYGILQREDVQLTMFRPRATSSLRDVCELPGVLHAEPFRTVPVRFRHEARKKNAAIIGVADGATLTALLDEDLRDVALPRDGLALSRKLAEILGVAAGDRVDVEVLEGRRRRCPVPIARVVDSFVGISAHMRLGPLCRLLGETESFNGAWLLVDEARIADLHARVKETPQIAGVTARDTLLRLVSHLLDQNVGVMVTIAVSFSLVMALGVLYNAARITLAERVRELASLRVLGFHRREVAAILLGELGLLVAIALPIGLVLGRWLAAVVVRTPGYDTEQFRLPLVILPSTYALAALTVLAAALVSGWAAWRGLDRFDIVEVLKTRD